MKYTEVKTQEELDAQAKVGNGVIVRAGFFVARGNSSVVARGNSSVEARGNSSVVAWENSSVVAWENSSVEAWENSSVEARGNSSVEARGNSSVVAWENSSVEAWGNSSVVAWENSSVEAWENSSVEAWENSSVEAWENSSVEAWENSSVEARGNSSVEARGNSSVVAWGNVFIRLFSALKIKASANVVIMRHGSCKSVRGGIKIEAIKITDIKTWCDFYGVKIAGGVVTLFKAVDEQYRSPKGGDYSPGTTPHAADWDGGKAECGHDLHFSPSPAAAKAFNFGAKKFVACPLKVDEIAVHPNGNYPEKVKARAVYKPCYEVDIHGNKI